MGDQSHPKSTEVSSAQKVSPSPVVDTSAQGLVFKDICVDVATKRILWSVSGHARPGAVLAILGPSGSGKTTLLNTLAGQVKKSSGLISLNGRNLTKKNRRKTSYVLQSDVFFPNLTLRETITVSMCTIVLCPIMNLCVCSILRC